MVIMFFGPLMRCVARRVTDATVLSVIKAWLDAPVANAIQADSDRVLSHSINTK
jgi:hypothetical protein